MSGQGIAFFADRCIECHGCEVACKSWNHIELGLSFRKIYKVWDERDPHLAKRVPATQACHHCDEPACALACPVSAIAKNAEDGAVLVDHDTCIGCQLCLTACPYDVPQFGADGTMQKCDLCYSRATVQGAGAQPCVATCPTGALKMP